MVISMTGYGESVVSNARGTLKVELKSVNHRFFEPVFRLPYAFSSLEHELKQRLGAAVRRGRVDVRLFFEASEEGEGRVKLDPAGAGAALKAVLELERLTGQHVENKAAIMAGMDGVFASGLPERADAPMKALAFAALEQALEGLNGMRRAEGRMLEQNVRDICASLAAHVEIAASIAARVPERQRERLSERIEQLLGDQAEEYYPGQRLAAEVALLVDKMAIDEEIVRLKSHLTQVLDTLAADDAIGKRLDFLAQELNREVNTIGSKSSDADLTALVVTMKNDVEKIREQVQNIE